LRVEPVGEGTVVLWFVLTGLSMAFVAVDIRNTPAHPVIKWSFVILALFTGPFVAFFYVLGCREPLRGTHEAYVAARWRQVLGSTMHCAAGDGLGIIAGAVIALGWHLPHGVDFALEYVLGFGFGWAIFQAFAMRDMAGGSYLSALKQTFLPELLSMNLLMAGMVVSMRYLMPRIVGGSNPLAGGFWLVVSTALIAGFALAYPVNWWLVANGLKHGMITVRPPDQVSQVPTRASPRASEGAHGAGHREHGTAAQVSIAAKAAAAVLTLAVLALAVALADRIGQ
jgi:hypothetical protein